MSERKVLVVEDRRFDREGVGKSVVSAILHHE